MHNDLSLLDMSRRHKARSGAWYCFGSSSIEINTNTLCPFHEVLEFFFRSVEFIVAITSELVLDDFLLEEVS